MPKPRMQSGQKYNRWITIELDHKIVGSQYWWLCECECGTRRAVRSGDLVNGKSKSCGCLQDDERNNYNPQEAFWKFVEKTEGCWIWIGAKIPVGYGVFNVKGKNIYAHRYVYELENGKIPSSLTVDHLCRNVSCVKPLHLEAVTLGENIRRAHFYKYGGLCQKRLHKMIGDNIFLNKKTGKTRCRACRNEYKRRKYLEKHDNRT